MCLNALKGVKFVAPWQGAITDAQEDKATTRELLLEVMVSLMWPGHHFYPRWHRQ